MSLSKSSETSTSNAVYINLDPEDASTGVPGQEFIRCNENSSYVRLDPEDSSTAVSRKAVKHTLIECQKNLAYEYLGPAT